MTIAQQQQQRLARIRVRREWERLRSDPTITEGEAVRRLNAFADQQRQSLRETPQ